MWGLVVLLLLLVSFTLGYLHEQLGRPLKFWAPQWLINVRICWRAYRNWRKCRRKAGH